MQMRAIHKKGNMAAASALGPAGAAAAAARPALLRAAAGTTGSAALRCAPLPPGSAARRGSARAAPRGGKRRSGERTERCARSPLTRKRRHRKPAFAAGGDPPAACQPGCSSSTHRYPPRTMRAGLPPPHRHGRGRRPHHS